MVDTGWHEHYFQCPYCTTHKGGHQVRVPKSVGKYRVKISYKDVLIFKCSRCSRVFKFQIMPDIIMWDRMTKKEKEKHKTVSYKRYKGGKVKT